MSFLLGGFGKSACTFLQGKTNKVGAYRYTSTDGLFFVMAQPDKDNEVIPCKDGAIFGKVFDKKSYEPLIRSENIVLPKILMNDYWGRYSGALYSKEDQSVSLVRDPLGLDTLFYVPYKDGLLFCSELQLLIDTLEQRPEFNWEYFIDYLVERNFIFAETPFNEVCELLPGMHLRCDIEGKRVSSFEWKIPHAEANDEDTIQKNLFDALEKSTRAWVLHEKNVCLQLSGGVDSSSILCLLKTVAPHAEIHGLHFNDSKIAASQEIDYAQQIARECAIPLHILDAQNTKIFSDLPAGWRPNKPSTVMASAENEEAIARVAKNSVVLSGQGGDHVFLAPPLTASIADYWLDKGFWGINGIFHELSSIYRTSWLALAQENLSLLKDYYQGRMSYNDTYVDVNILSTQAQKSFSLKPSFIDQLLFSYPPGKREHIRALYHAVAYADQNASGKTIFPLLSLPVVEEALKIPTYRSFKHGYDRYFLRKAISSISDTTVIWRRNKGEVSASVVKSLQKEFDSMLKLVNEGMLLRYGILNKEWFEEKCTRIAHGDANNLIPLFRVFAVEKWFKQWGYKN